MKKKVIFTALILAICLIFAACGQGETPEPSQPVTPDIENGDVVGPVRTPELVKPDEMPVLPDVKNGDEPVSNEPHELPEPVKPAEPPVPPEPNTGIDGGEPVIPVVPQKTSSSNLITN